jgi:hypothetical protein
MGIAAGAFNVDSLHPHRPEPAIAREVAQMGRLRGLSPVGAQMFLPRFHERGVGLVTIPVKYCMRAATAELDASPRHSGRWNMSVHHILFSMPPQSHGIGDGYGPITRLNPTRLDEPLDGRWGRPLR